MEARTKTDQATGADAVGPAATRHILERLREAVQLAEHDLPDNLERFREVIEQVSDQTDAWVLTRLAIREAQSDRPALRLECAMLARPGGDPLEEFLLIPFGEVKVERPVAGADFVFTARHAESARCWLERIGRKLAIDYEHQSFDRYNTRPDGLRPAAGWVGRLEVRDDGLWACDVTWTERAKELLRSGEYRYFSPVIYWTDEDYTDVAALGPVALTNDPAMRGVRPLAASRRGPDQQEAAEDAASEGALAAGAAGGESESVLRGEIEALNDEIELLRRQLEAQEADAFVEQGMRLGKILDSTSMDWREDYLRDPEHTRNRLERAPVLLPPGRVIKLNARGEVVREGAGNASKRSAGASGHALVDAEDLAAYDRALAAGRIRRFGASEHS